MPQAHPVGAVVPEKVIITEQVEVGNPVIVPAVLVERVPMVAPVQLVASTVGAEPPPIWVRTLMSRQFEAVEHELPFPMSTTPAAPLWILVSIDPDRAEVEVKSIRPVFLSEISPELFKLNAILAEAVLAASMIELPKLFQLPAKQDTCPAVPPSFA